MGQRYRKVLDKNYLEPSRAQMVLLESANEDGRVSITCECCGKQHSCRVIRSCLERGWITSPQNPEYGNQYLRAEWFITKLGIKELKHQRKRASLAKTLGIENRPSISRLM